jgi:hypothetical protein
MLSTAFDLMLIRRLAVLVGPGQRRVVRVVVPVAGFSFIEDEPAG